MKTFGEQLFEARMGKGMTQEQIADAVGVTRQGVSNWERGRSMPETELVEKMSSILGCEFDITVEPEAAEDDCAGETGSAPNNRSRNGKTGMICRRSAWIMTAAGFLAGLLVMFILMNWVLPDFGNEAASAVNEHPDVESYTVPWFTADRVYADDAAEVVISFNENPAMPGEDPNMPDVPVWFYSIYFSEVNGYDFIPETYEEYYFDGDSMLGESIYNEDDLICWFGKNLIRANGLLQMRGGMPVQDMTGIGIRITGRDANGNAKEFFGFLELSKGTPEA